MSSISSSYSVKMISPYEGAGYFDLCRSPDGHIFAVRPMPEFGNVEEIVCFGQSGVRTLLTYDRSAESVTFCNVDPRFLVMEFVDTKSNAKRLAAIFVDPASGRPVRFPLEETDYTLNFDPYRERALVAFEKDCQLRICEVSRGGGRKVLYEIPLWKADLHKVKSSFAGEMVVQFRIANSSMGYYLSLKQLETEPKVREGIEHAIPVGIFAHTRVSSGLVFGATKLDGKEVAAIWSLDSERTWMLRNGDYCYSSLSQAIRTPTGWLACGHGVYNSLSGVISTAIAVDSTGECVELVSRVTRERGVELYSADEITPTGRIFCHGAINGENGLLILTPE